MTISGKIVKIKDTEIVKAKTEGGKVFHKREFWLETPDEKYPQTICLELHGDKVILIDSFRLEQQVSVDINLKGKITQDKCFNTLQVWRITAPDSQETNT